MDIKGKIANMHRSLTIWFNVGMGATLQYLPDAKEQFPQLQDYLPANLFHWAMGTLVVGNVLLRFKTKTSLENK